MEYKRGCSNSFGRTSSARYRKYDGSTEEVQISSVFEVRSFILSEFFDQ